MTEEFEFVENARRTATPLLIGLISPTGGGKTYSALRLATGIQRVRGGKIIGIDTETKRMLHYADDFNITHLNFKPPFSSERYRLALIAAAEKADGGVVILDSTSHEHEGEGGYLEYHEAELNRLVEKSTSSEPEWKIRDKNNFSAWIKPSASRRKLINTILQLDCAFIFCFRAKEKLQLVSGKNPIQLGWQPVAGEEFSFEMTVRCLLQPGSQGVPDWSAEAFKHGAAKRPHLLTGLIPDGQQLDEDVGEELAKWAMGSAYFDRPLEELKTRARDAALGGEKAFDAWILNQLTSDKAKLKPFGAELRKTAIECNPIYEQQKGEE